MTTTRRLHGIAAISAATLATAAMAGPGIAADECDDEACGDPQVSLIDLVKAFGGEEIPEGALIKIEAMYEQLGMEDPAAAFLKLGDIGTGDPEEALAKLTEFYEQLGMGDLGGAFLKLGDAEGSFAKIEVGELAPEDAMVKIDGVDGESLEEAFLKIDAAMPAIEEALNRIGASEDIDPA
ncbi:MAG: hypothetical protein U9O18_06415, partial [Chloroflexota bacterium]|nr:hypothetical protein [Chloroflexota bacterium]